MLRSSTDILEYTIARGGATAEDVVVIDTPDSNTNGSHFAGKHVFGLQFYLNNKEDADAFSSTIYAYLFSLVIGSIYFKGLPPCKVTDAFGILGYGTLTMSIGGIFLALGISCTEAFTANLICMLEVILAPLWAFLFFHETISIISFIGATLVVGGIILNLILDFKKAAK